MFLIASIKHSYDAIALVVLICYYALCFYFVAILANKSHFGYITAMVLHLENVSVSMKISAVFVINCQISITDAANNASSFLCQDKRSKSLKI